MSLLKHFSSDPNAVINDFRMSISHPQYEKVTLYVEGQTDVMLFRNIVNEDIVKLIPVEGKKNVIDVMRVLYGNYPDRVYAVCDADFDHITGKARDHLEYGVLVTDYHDMEIMMFHSSAFEKVINQKAINNRNGLSRKILDEVFNICKTIGIIRLISLERNYSLRFKSLVFGRFVNFKNGSLEIDLDNFLNQLLSASSQLVSKDKLMELYFQYLLVSYDIKQLCCGHDCSNVLALYLRESSNIQGNTFSRDRVEKDLMLAFNEYNKYSVLNEIKNIA